MYSIKQAFQLEAPWEQCAISLANALYALPTADQFALAIEIRDAAEPVLKKNKPSSTSAIGFMRVADLLGQGENVDEAESSPDLVQWEVADEALSTAQSSTSLDEVTLCVVSAVSSYIFSAQIHTWMHTDLEDYHIWQTSPVDAKGVYASRSASVIGKTLWLGVDKYLRYFAKKNNIEEYNIYRVTKINSIVVDLVEEGRL